ncbi:glycoside hydrolase family 3 C-terminal domain-containing protein [Diplocloster agilis]|uniref:glycoside hydrolase family 3 C-terminal domain-containing protein n=1 Tax=Diplocloster agilis TaxID=2850323 RepID=UPI0008205C78|nr:glycoside hydrolase family 3 C-terminal domain-containing protein [Suonthocola fibrivorans]MCU6733678.1 glycoside hydrolase family 3 C-terminal domain-containing protein [Suonthocola fibrivorans]SCJ03629.1 Periplasmic beta-glucosidase precursor [uncultured Clostridium sp.]
MEREEARRRAKELTELMTVEEKAAQLKYDAPPLKRLNIPAYNWWNEGLHGVARAGCATIYPQAIGMAAVFDEELLRQVADQIATECRAKFNAYSQEGDRDIYKGLTLWSPNINMFRDPRWGRGQETYGEDPYLTKKLGVAFVKGLQGDGKYLKTAACAKHFAVHSGPEAQRHEFDARATAKDMEETYLPAFEALVKEAHVEAVMGAYNRTNGEPCCASKTLIQETLRKKWGFLGHFVSDCWAIRDFHQHHKVTSAPEESAAMALKTGCDLNCGNTYLRILQAYQKGLVTEEEITRSAERLMTTRILLGMHSTDNEYDNIPYDKVECREHLHTSEEMARKGIVLLKNNGILPLDKSRLKTIGVIGPNADSRTALIGNYHGTATEYITLLRGILNEAGEGTRVLYSVGCHIVKDRCEHLAWRQDRLSEARIVAKQSDVVIMNLGLNEFLEGEEGDTGNEYGSGDKQDLQLPLVQRELLEEVVGAGKPVILCVSSGSALDLSFAQEHCAAVLQLWYPGARGGKSAADILFGRCSPSGKLPVTFYKDLDELPPFEDYSMKNRTYRYMKTQALYPFGYGLTYGKVEVLGITPEKQDAEARLKVKIKNTGKVKTDEVLQIYIRNLDSAYADENYHLCGFKRICTEPGQEAELDFCVEEREFTVVDDEGRRFRDGKRFRFYAGFHQPDKRSCELSGSGVMQVELEW